MGNQRSMLVVLKLIQNPIKDFLNFYRLHLTTKNIKRSQVKRPASKCASRMVGLSKVKDFTGSLGS